MATPERWRTLQARGPRIAVWVLAVAIGVQAAFIVTRLAGAGHAAAPVTAAPVANSPTRTVDVATIARAKLFGEAPVAVASGEPAPATSMPLVLSGIISARDPKSGMAILGPTVQAAKVYAVGDSVPGGAKLNAVYEDHVLLDRGGSLETLSLPRQFARGGAAPPPLARTSPVESVRRIIDEQPSIIGRVLRPQVVFDNGHQRGFRVYPGSDRGAFMQLGLRPGDLVTAINGTPLDDPARGDEIMRTLGSATEARVTVMRNGRQQDLTLNLSQVATEADQLSRQPGND